MIAVVPLQKERAAFLDDCGPLPAGEVADEGAEFQKS
jgi:hypothetical protein